MAYVEGESAGAEPRVLHKFQLACTDVYFLRFQMDPARTLLALGNTRGEVALWAVDEPQDKPLASFVLPLQYHRRAPTTIRHTALSHDMRHLVCCCDDSSVVVWQLQRLLQS